MIKTLIAIGLTTLCGLNNVKKESSNVIHIDGNNNYIGYEAEDFLITNKYNFHYTSRNANTGEEQTISDHINNHQGFVYWSTNIKYGSQDTECYLLLSPKQSTLNNVVELVKCNFILDYRNNINPQQKIELGLGDWTTESNRTITKSFNPSSYEILNILLPNNLNEHLLYIISNIETNAIIYSTIGYYNVKTYQLNGGLSPYKDLGSNNNVDISANLSDFPQNTTEHKQQEILNTWFISNGQLWNSFDVYGISEKVTYNPNTSNSFDRARLEYRYSNFNNTYNNSSVVVNVIENSEINNWTDYNFRTITLLESDKKGYINGIYQYQYGSLLKHTNNNSYYQITSNTNITDIFTLLGNAFNGFGNLFNVTILPGINLGALITIPLLLGIILWLIHMFKRGG